jgi:hypothetical protein
VAHALRGWFTCSPAVAARRSSCREKPEPAPSRSAADHRLPVNVGSCRRVTRARDLREMSRPTAIPIPPRIAPTTGMPAIKMMTNTDSSIGGMARGTFGRVKQMVTYMDSGADRRTFANATGRDSCRRAEQTAAVEGGLLRSTPRRSLLVHPRINPLVDVAKLIGDLITPSSRSSGVSPLRSARKRIAGRVHG